MRCDLFVLLFAVVFFVFGCASVENKSESVAAPKLTTQSDDLDSAMINSWGAQKDFFIEKDFEIVPWEKAALLEQKFSGGKQYHTGWITLYGIRGEKWLTRLAEYDDIYTFFKENNLKLKGFATE